MATPALSIHLSNHGDAAAIVEDVVRVDERGVARVWLSEDLFHRGAMPVAAAALARTSRVEIAFGVLAPQHRHPASLAMDLRSLTELAPGRVVIGLGAGVAERARLIGQTASPPLRIVDESVTAVRTLLRAEQLTQDGVLHLSRGLSLSVAPVPHDPPPVYVAAVGPKALAQAGRSMDGVVLTMMCSREHARWAAERVREAAARAARAQPPVVAYLPIAVDEDGDAARERMRRVLGGFVAAWSKLEFLSKLFTDWSEIDHDRMTRVGAAVVAGDSLQSLLPDRIVEQFCVAGTPAQCRETLEAFGEAGVDEVALDAGEDLAGVLEFLSGAPGTR